jgi:hypothetical protein
LFTAFISVGSRPSAISPLSRLRIGPKASWSDWMVWAVLELAPELASPVISGW